MSVFAKEWNKKTNFNWIKCALSEQKLLKCANSLLKRFYEESEILELLKASNKRELIDQSVLNLLSHWGSEFWMSQFKCETQIFYTFES